MAVPLKATAVRRWQDAGQHPARRRRAAEPGRARGDPRTAGYRLVRAQTADEALLALLDDDFAAIVLDIQMPGMSGIELAQLIKQRKRTQHIPILFLTAHLFDEERRAARATTPAPSTT